MAGLASVLHNLLVKKASELHLDSFISKVASALPISKRAAFRVIQTQLATGDSLPDAIKVAFPRLNATERHALAINFCKCAVADANKMTRREPESYNVPAKDAASTMKKCAKLDQELGTDTQPVPKKQPAMNSVAPEQTEQKPVFTAAPGMLDKIKAFHAANPYVLPGLGIGAAGLGAYGLYNAMKKKRRRPQYED